MALQGQARVFPNSASALAGAQLDLSIPLVPNAELAIRAGIAFGARDDALGSISLGLASVRLAPGLVARPHPQLAFVAGPTFEIGAGWAAGSSSLPGVTTRLGTASVVALGLTGCLRAEVASPVWLVSCIDGGGALAGLRIKAQAREAGGLRGIALGASVGAAVAF